MSFSMEVSQHLLVQGGALQRPDRESPGHEEKHALANYRKKGEVGLSG